MPVRFIACLLLGALLATRPALAEPLPEFVYKPFRFAEDSAPKISALIQQASETSYDKPKASRKMTVDALAMARDGQPISTEDHSFALYLFLKNCFVGPGSDEMQPDARADYMKVARVLRTKLAPTVGSWVYTPWGKFEIEAYITASNGLAWFMYEDAQKKPGNTGLLKEALTVIQDASHLIDDPQHFYARDTEVRLLIALGRHEEAFKIVKQTLDETPDFDEFSDFASNKRYLDWAKRQPR